MKEPASKLQEGLLYLASPIGLLAVWQVLLWLGFGDRRFVPAPSDIAVRFWQLMLNGDLELHTAATLWRAGDGEGGTGFYASYLFWLAGPTDAEPFDGCSVLTGCPTRAGVTGTPYA